MRLTENLRLFNTKERFHLVSLALGNSDFTISESFRQILNDSFAGLNFKKLNLIILQRWIIILIGFIQACT